MMFLHLAKFVQDLHMRLKLGFLASVKMIMAMIGGTKLLQNGLLGLIKVLPNLTHFEGFRNIGIVRFVF
ncbi:hypothetical protein HTG_04575 [Natrinema mahii]|nr:hypothetical protein HTG_04575 [Natrinema mahii]